jgi:hypothetical protein
MTFDLDQLTKILAVEMTARTFELWRAVITENCNHLESPSACLSLSDHWHTHRLIVCACTPAGMLQSRTGESITCDPARKPEAIAADICTRILPDAKSHLKQCVDYDKKRRQEEAEKKLRLNFLKKYLPREYQREKLCNDSPHRSNVFAHITYENLINIEATVTLKQALKILQFIQDLQGNNNHENAS